MFKRGDKVVWVDNGDNAFTGVVWDVDAVNNPETPYLIQYEVAGRTHTVWPRNTKIYIHRNYEG